MKKFLSIISLIYFTIILYIILTNNLSNILAPRMHINIILGGIALFILSISSLFGHSHYKFKLIDLVLLVPIIMVILGGDFRLSSSLAGNRNRYVSNNSNNKYSGDTSINGNEKVDYVIDDDIYITATNLFSFGSSYDKYEGKVIKIRGFVQKNKDFITPGYFAIGKYAVTCCVADSSFIGVLVKEDKTEVVDEGWYEVVGKLYKIVDKYGYTSLALKTISINKIQKEDSLYVYPCYEGKCIDKLKKYGLNSFE